MFTRGPGLILVGLALVVIGLIVNHEPVAPEDGANIGAGLLIFFGLALVLSGVIAWIVEGRHRR